MSDGPPPLPTPDAPTPGWYADPSTPSQLRWWDGEAWTGATQASVQQQLPTVDPWLWQSILVTVLCCNPVSIAGIVFASQSMTAMTARNVTLAREKARVARILTLVAIGLSVLIIIAYIAFVVFAIAAEFSGY